MALFIADSTDVPAAGTRVQINNTARKCYYIIFKARSGNTGAVYIGGSAVSAADGYALLVGDTPLALNFKDAGGSCPMSDFWVDAATNGNDVDWAAIIGP